MNEIFQLNQQKYKSRYEELETLARGAFGTVLKARDRTLNKIVAVKTISKANSKETAITQLKNEVCGLKQSQHQNIVKLFDFYETEQFIYIIMEYIKGGTLRNYWDSHNRHITEKNTKVIVYYLLQAVEYLHKSNIIHRDIKLDNIMFDDVNDLSTLKVIDFGLSTQLGQRANSEFCGTIIYMSPERLFADHCIKVSDIWSIGIIMYILLNGCHPFYAKGDTKEIFYEKVRKKTIEMKRNVSKEAKLLLNSLLEIKINMRYTASIALSHKWFFNIRECIHEKKCDYIKRDIKKVGRDLILISILISNWKSYKKELDDEEEKKISSIRIDDSRSSFDNQTELEREMNLCEDIRKVPTEHSSIQYRNDSSLISGVSPYEKTKNKSTNCIIKAPCIITTQTESLIKNSNKKSNLFLKSNNVVNSKMSNLFHLTSRRSCKYFTYQTIANANANNQNIIDLKRPPTNHIYNSPRKSKIKLTFNRKINTYTDRKLMKYIPINRTSSNSNSITNSSSQQSEVKKKRVNSYSKGTIKLKVVKQGAKSNNSSVNLSNASSTDETKNKVILPKINLNSNRKSIKYGILKRKSLKSQSESRIVSKLLK